MGKSSGSQPAVPDAKDMGRVQAGVDFNTTRANVMMGNMNTVGPDGKTTYSYEYDNTFPNQSIPIATQTVTLSPGQQAIYDKNKATELSLANTANTQAGKIGTLLNTPVTAGAILPTRVTATPTAPTLATSSAAPSLTGNATLSNVAAGGAIQNSLGNTDYAGQRTAVEDAIYSRLNPQLERDRLALENRLVNQGFQRGSEAFIDQMDEYNRQANDARMQAVLAGGNEQTRLANLAQMSGQFANQAQQQGFDQASQRTLANNQTALDQANFTNQKAQQQFQNAQQVNQTNNQRAMDLYNVAMQNAAFQNNNRQDAMQETMALRNQPINEITSLLSGSQVNVPQFQKFNYTPMQSPQVMQAAYNSAALQNQQWQQQQQNQNAMMGGLFGLGSAGIYGGLMRSDRRLKRDIVDMGIKLRNGIKLYAYRYAWEAKRRVGVMADEVARVVPDAVVRVSGYDAVDYGRVMRAA